MKRGRIARRQAVGAATALVFFGVSVACHQAAPAGNSNTPWISSQRLGSAPVYQNDPGPLDPVGGGPSITYTATILSAWRADLVSLHRTLQARGVLTKEQKGLLPLYRLAIKQNFFDAESESVVIVVTYAGSTKMERALSDFWKARTQEELLPRLTLVGDGMRIAPLRVSLQEERPLTLATRVYWVVLGFQVFFPRQVEGRPLLALDMEKVYLEVDGPYYGKVKLPFEVKKMVVNGGLVY